MFVSESGSVEGGKHWPDYLRRSAASVQGTASAHAKTSVMFVVKKMAHLHDEGHTHTHSLSVSLSLVWTGVVCHISVFVFVVWVMRAICCTIQPADAPFFPKYDGHLGSICFKQQQPHSHYKLNLIISLLCVPVSVCVSLPGVSACACTCACVRVRVRVRVCGIHTCVLSTGVSTSNRRRN